MDSCFLLQSWTVQQRTRKLCWRWWQWQFFK